MTYLTRRPPPPLDRYIDCLWHVDLRVGYQREKILPTGTVELIINFGAPFRLYTHADPARLQLQTDSWLVGLQTGYLVNEPLAETHMVGVRFKPGGVSAFFGAAVANDVIPLDALWGRAAEIVREQLYAVSVPSARFALLEQLLLERLYAQPRGLDAVLYAVDEIARCDGSLSIRDLSAALDMSQKHLIDRFRQHVGISPKAVARIYRFQAVLEAIDPSRDVDWAAVAHGALYYDQAHFNHDFTAFTGLRPTEYLRLRQQYYGDALVRGEALHFVPLG